MFILSTWPFSSWSAHLNAIDCFLWSATQKAVLVDIKFYIEAANFPLFRSDDHLRNESKMTYPSVPVNSQCQNIGCIIEWWFHAIKVAHEKRRWNHLIGLILNVVDDEPRICFGADKQFSINTSRLALKASKDLERSLLWVRLCFLHNFTVMVLLKKCMRRTCQLSRHQQWSNSSKRQKPLAGPDRWQFQAI